MAMNNVKLRLETTAPFQGLAELVAYDEGLFAKEAIEIEWMDREKGVDKSAQMHITNHKDAGRYTSHGKMMEQGGIIYLYHRLVIIAHTDKLDGYVQFPDGLVRVKNLKLK